MENKLSVLSFGRSDTIDILSPAEMNNILGGDGPGCQNGYCQENYTENPALGIVNCGCGYVKPIKDNSGVNTDPIPARP